MMNMADMDEDDLMVLLLTVEAQITYNNKNNVLSVEKIHDMYNTIYVRASYCTCYSSKDWTRNHVHTPTNCEGVIINRLNESFISNNFNVLLAIGSLPLSFSSIIKNTQTIAFNSPSILHFALIKSTHDNNYFNVIMIPNILCPISIMIPPSVALLGFRSRHPVVVNISKSLSTNR